MQKENQKLKSNKNKGAYLFGPFIGEVTWEFFRFAPYSIYKKKIDSSSKLIVLTRKSRFDFYGKYSDILVPLDLVINDSEKKQSEFGVIGYSKEYYDSIANHFFEKYKNEYEILGHFYPRIEEWKRKIKWQFPRDKMDYNFLPRKLNDELIDKFIGNYINIVFVDRGYKFETQDYLAINFDDFIQYVSENIDNIKATFYGCLISLLKRVDFTIGNLKNEASFLSILLGKPLISVNETLSYDSVRLLNPLNVPIINCSNAEEGVKIYENNF